MNSKNLVPFLGLNKLENKILNLCKVSGPIRPGAIAHGARRSAPNNGQTAAWASAWRPGPAGIRPATGNVACARLARSWRGHHARSARAMVRWGAHWWLVAASR
jgi:hypothetical protein